MNRWTNKQEWPEGWLTAVEVSSQGWMLKLKLWALEHCSRESDVHEINWNVPEMCMKHGYFASLCIAPLCISNFWICSVVNQYSANLTTAQISVRLNWIIGWIRLDSLHYFHFGFHDSMTWDAAIMCHGRLPVHWSSIGLPDYSI